MTFTDRTAALLVGHGSRDPRAAHVVNQLVAAVATLTGGEVRAAHLDFTAPTPDVVLRDLATDGFGSVRVVPLLFTPGFHVTQDVPRAIEASGVTRRIDVTLAPPLLSGGRRVRHLMLRALADRLAQAGAGDEVEALVLASAGSSSDLARRHIETLARDLEGAYGIPALPAFVSGAGPSPAQALDALSDKGIRRPAIASLFVAPGRLTDSVLASCPDVPVADPLGVSPAFVELLAIQTQLLPRVTQAAAR